MDEAQLSALINAAVREAVERTTRELAAQHEADTEGLRRKRDELLDKVAKKDGKTPVTHDNFDEWLAGLDARIAKIKEETARITGKVEAPAAPQVRAHSISRDEARNPQAYREAKARAQAAGVELEIVDANAAPQGRRGSPVKYVSDDDAGTLWVNQSLVERHGQQRMRQKAADEGKQFRAFRDVTDLPDEIAARHAEIIASGDRSNLLGDQ